MASEIYLQYYCVNLKKCIGTYLNEILTAVFSHTGAVADKWIVRSTTIQ